MVDKLGVTLAVLRLISISLQLISISRKLLFESFAVLLVLIRLLATTIKLAQHVLCWVKVSLRIEKNPSSKAGDVTTRGLRVIVSDH